MKALKVKEIISKLSKCDPESFVLLIHKDSYYDDEDKYFHKDLSIKAPVDVESLDSVIITHKNGDLLTDGGYGRSENVEIISQYFSWLSESDNIAEIKELAAAQWMPDEIDLSKPVAIFW